MVIKSAFNNDKLLDFILSSFIVSIFYYVPYFGSLFWFHIILNAIIVIIALFVLLENNGKFLLKKNGVYLFCIFIISILYSLLIFNIQFVFIFSVIFSIAYASLGYHINGELIKLSFLSRLASILLFFGLTWVVLAKFIPSLNYVYNIDYGITIFDLNLYNNGYNVGRTGWNTSLVVIYFLFLLLLNNCVKIFDKIICYSNLFLIIASTLVSDGKTGIIIIVSFFIFNFMRKIGYILSSVFLVSSFLLVSYYFNYIKIFLIENTRLGMIFDSSADFTTGRNDASLTAIEIIKDNIIIGTAYKGGYNLFDYGYEYKDIHNVWLNLIANFGVVYFLFYITFLGLFVFNAIKISKKYGENSYIYYQLILACFIITLVEPWVFVSYLPYMAIFWFILGSMSKSSKIK